MRCWNCEQLVTEHCERCGSCEPDVCPNVDHCHPSEWPGGCIIMDDRTSHATRRADWERKNQDQIALIVSICTSGTSPQCDRKDG